MPLIINIIGIGRKSGKTSLIEHLIREFSKKKYNVASVKHISEGSFDTTNKDTWKHLQAGAVKVIAVSQNEIVSLQRINAPTLDMAIKEIGDSIDFILVEGFKDAGYPKIITARTLDEVKELIKNVKEVFAISGPVVEKVEMNSYHDIPILKHNEVVDKLEEIINNISKSITNRKQK